MTYWNNRNFRFLLSYDNYQNQTSKNQYDVIWLFRHSIKQIRSLLTLYYTCLLLLCRNGYITLETSDIMLEL